MSRRRRVDARIWPADGSSFSYPESRAGRPPTAVCFSGGGTRSYAATIGQLRGLTATGLLSQVGYISAVSGGAWAATAHAFYAGPGQTDADILGLVREPRTLDQATQTVLSPSELGHAATRNFRATLESLHVSPDVPADRIWVRAVGETFLAPFGLFDAECPCGFTCDEASEREISQRNPDVGTLHRVRLGTQHPYLIVHATLNWPADGNDTASKVGFEYTPLYCGSPPLTQLRSGDRSVYVGGGVIESVAFGSGPPLGPVGSDGVVAVEQTVPFTLADVIGASSAFSTSARDLRLYPHVECWPIPPTAGPSHAHMFTDGGDLENFGIIPLLRRGIRSIVVFINTVWPLSLALDADRGWPVDPAPESRVLDPFLAPLFGAPSGRFPHNQVFPETDFPILLRALQEAKRAGRAVLATMNHTVQNNVWWGLSGGGDVRVCWVYNERVLEWEALLPADTRRALQRGSADPPSGPLAHFPHYRTRGQNRGAIIRLTPTQINLLSHLGCWMVTSCADELRDVLA